MWAYDECICLMLIWCEFVITWHERNEWGYEGHNLCIIFASLRQTVSLLHLHWLETEFAVLGSVLLLFGTFYNLKIG